MVCVDPVVVSHWRTISHVTPRQTLGVGDTQFVETLPTGLEIELRHVGNYCFAYTFVYSLWLSQDVQECISHDGWRSQELVFPKPE